MIERVKKCIEDSVKLKTDILGGALCKDIVSITRRLTQALEKGNKVMFCGNGGSAADSQHMAAELVNRFYINRAPLSAIALTTDTAVLTSIGNDFSYDDIFEKQIQALGLKGDVLIALSTSGRSKNMIKAVQMARSKGIYSIGFTGQGPNPLSEEADLAFAVPSRDTPRIQEAHYMTLHIICGLIEESIFGNAKSPRP